MSQHPDVRSYRGRTVLITGASSGLGAQFARVLAGRGAGLVLVARRRERLEELAVELRAAHGVQVDVIPADLAAPGASADLVAAVDEAQLPVDSVVLCAGFGLGGDLVTQDPARLTEMITVNVVALTELARLLLPRLVAAREGFLLTVASTAAYQPTPGLAVYGATKAYVLSLTEAIAEETRSSGLRVLALSPGPTSTEFFDVAGGDGLAVGNFQSVEQVVDTALAALDRSLGRTSVISGSINRIGAFGTRLLPRRVTAAIARRAIG